MGFYLSEIQKVSKEVVRGKETVTLYSPNLQVVCVCVLVCIHAQQGTLPSQMELTSISQMEIADVLKKIKSPTDLCSLLPSLPLVNSGCSLLLLHIPDYQLQTEVHQFSGKKNILYATRRLPEEMTQKGKSPHRRQNLQPLL